MYQPTNNLFSAIKTNSNQNIADQLNISSMCTVGYIFLSVFTFIVFCVYIVFLFFCYLASSATATTQINKHLPLLHILCSSSTIG